MKLLGILFLLFGCADLVASLLDYDLWLEGLGVELPEVLWRKSYMIEILFGLGILRAARDETPDDDATETSEA